MGRVTAAGSASGERVTADVSRIPTASPVDRGHTIVLLFRFQDSDSAAHMLGDAPAALAPEMGTGTGDRGRLRIWRRGSSRCFTYFHCGPGGPGAHHCVGVLSNSVSHAAVLILILCHASTDVQMKHSTFPKGHHQSCPLSSKQYKYRDSLLCCR